jgi:hypothetical protein
VALRETPKRLGIAVSDDSVTAAPEAIGLVLSASSEPSPIGQPATADQRRAKRARQKNNCKARGVQCVAEVVGPKSPTPPDMKPPHIKVNEGFKLILAV